MALPAGTRLGVYEVTAQIGAGGMGEVYRATDTNLKRSVAIKVLPDSVAGDADRLARFQREAELLAALNHPNIASIYGLERAAGFTALVMELVEGDDLSQRVARGAIPMDEALAIAKQIAEALETAHDRGIIHRDLKPANIKVRADGTVKVLDFGLAKAADASQFVAQDLTHSPTVYDGTLAGVLLGTAAYMSPEQARGKSVDARTDIWAFGCIVFEMLTGRAPFAGDTLTDILAVVVKVEPAWSNLPAATPPSLRRVLRRCLQKDATRRYHSIADVRIDIEEDDGRSDDRATLNIGGFRAVMPRLFVGTALAALVVVGAGILLNRRTTRQATRPTTRVELTLPKGVELYHTWHGVGLAGNGRTIAFVGVTGGVRQVFTRRLEEFTTVAVKGTEQVTAFVLSPRGDALAFARADRTLNRIAFADGLVVRLAADADYGSGISWGDDDRITFSREGTLWQVAAAGGTATRLTTLNVGQQEVVHGWPTSVAGGQQILFTCVTGPNTTRIESVASATGERRVLIDGARYPLYAETGHLLFLRDSALFATSFDPSQAVPIGQPVRVLDAVPTDSTGAPLVSLSAEGALLYAPPGSTLTRIVFVARDGTEGQMTDPGPTAYFPKLSRNGREIVTATGDAIWLTDVSRGTSTRITTTEQTVGGAMSYPVWTPDEKTVIFQSRFGLRRLDVLGGSRSQPLGLSSMNDFPTAVSPDGRTLLFGRIVPATSSDIFALDLDNPTQMRPLLNSPAFEGGATFSPDGLWIAYVSNESGEMQVYLRRYPRADRRWQLSSHGGTQPVWNKNGRELFYRDADKMMAVDVVLKDEPTLSQPHVLFDRHYASGPISIADYDVAADGRTFVMVKNDAESAHLNLILNWTEELKRLAPPR